jgi:hypothetical protein
MMPRLVIVVEIERVPIGIIDVTNEGEERRLLDWLDSQPDLADIVALAFTSAVELMREARRAA